MTIHRLQTQAIEKALRTKNLGTVHVMGPKEGSTELLANERSCDAPNEGQNVVYHVDVRPTHDARHVCAACGEMTGATSRPAGFDS